VGDWVTWAGVIALLALMLLSALRLALSVPSRVRLAEEFDRTGNSEGLEQFVTARPQYVLATATLRTVCMFMVFVSALRHAGTVAAPQPSVRTIIALVLALLLVLVFGVAVPTAWAKYCGEWLTVRSLPLLAVLRVICLPVTVVLQMFDPLVRRLAAVPVRDEKSYADELEQEILNVVSEGERHGAVDEEEKEMIESVIELSDTYVEEIMTPRTDVVAISKDSELDTVIESIRANGHSRIPVYEGTIDTIQGILYAKDLLRRDTDEPFDLAKIMRPAIYVPESKLVRQLLREFQEQKVHIAVVLDEYGGTAGLVTIEDILEELVGEITDEYDTDAPAELDRIDEQTVEVDARMKIDELNDELNISLPEDDDYETIGGFVFSRLGRIPVVGEAYEHENIGIQVIEADLRRILRLRLSIRSTTHDGAVLP